MMRMYCVYDNVSKGCVGPIIQERADASAIRSFKLAVADREGQLGKYPKDYELMCIGIFDEYSGDIILNDNEFPKIVVTGAQIELGL
ncbi:MAG: nonstructural protein [Microvirus sp.]|nr:MAG: nonstructural protein [Microvirus sp.]